MLVEVMALASFCGVNWWLWRANSGREQSEEQSRVRARGQIIGMSHAHQDCINSGSDESSENVDARVRPTRRGWKAGLPIRLQLFWAIAGLAFSRTIEHTAIAAKIHVIGATGNTRAQCMATPAHP